MAYNNRGLVKSDLGDNQALIFVLVPITVQLNWVELWANESEREQVAVMAMQWCDRLQRQCESLAS